jgi:hypothetical protein
MARRRAGNGSTRAMSRGGVPGTLASHRNTPEDTMKAPVSRSLHFPLAAAAACVAALTLVLTTAPAEAADPSSIQAIFERLPELPASVEAAATWVDRPISRVTHAPLRAWADALEAHSRQVQAIARSRDAHQQRQGELRTQAMMQGMSDAGIDTARMQRDPAYRAEMQARMQAMSPAELMAMAQKMNQPMNRDARLDNEAVLLSQDLPAVQAAGEAGFAYAQDQVRRLEARAAIWREADAAVARITARPLKVAAAKPRIEWDSPGCDKGCQAQWDGYAAQMLPLMIARENEILGVRRLALQRHRAAVAPEIEAAERHLAATRYGAAAKSQTNLMRITGYDGVAVGELQHLLQRIEESVKRAAVVPQCGRQIVLVPGAVCS